MVGSVVGADVLNLAFDNWNVELKDGSVKNVGPTNKATTAKLFDVEAVEVREFGDKRVKLAFDDGEGNEVEIALFPEQASEVARGIELLEDESVVFE
jgi:hypothetical protein